MVPMFGCLREIGVVPKPAPVAVVTEVEQLLEMTPRLVVEK